VHLSKPSTRGDLQGCGGCRRTSRPRPSSTRPDRQIARSWSRRDQILSGIGLISSAGARFEAPETIFAQGRFEDVHRSGYDPEQHLETWRSIFRAYNDWLAEFCRTDPARLKGITTINLDDVEDAIKELERAARLGLAGAMITEYPAEDRRYDQPEYEPFWAAAALDLLLSLHTATRRQGKIRGAGPGTLRDASSRATKAFYPALSLCDLIFSGVFERHPHLTLAIVEFELAWAPNVLSSMDYTYRERLGEAIYRFKRLPSRRWGTACSQATSSAATSF
jgi:predicted TIM-barrel fold metal-dependent hydrolase